MKITFGEGKSKYGPGVAIDLSPDEVASAIDEYVKARGIQVKGPRTVTVGSELCRVGRIYVDPSGEVVYGNERWMGFGEKSIITKVSESVADQSEFDFEPLTQAIKALSTAASRLKKESAAAATELRKRAK